MKRVLILLFVIAIPIVAWTQNAYEKNIGKAICEVLKNIRKTVADANNIIYYPDNCRHQGGCPGTCPKCEEELRLLTEELHERKSRGISIYL